MRKLRIALLVVPMLAVGGLGCSRPLTGYDQASRARSEDYEPLPPTYLKNGRHNPEAPPPI